VNIYTAYHISPNHQIITISNRFNIALKRNPDTSKPCSIQAFYIVAQSKDEVISQFKHYGLDIDDFALHEKSPRGISITLTTTNKDKLSHFIGFLNAYGKINNISLLQSMKSFLSIKTEVEEKAQAVANAKLAENSVVNRTLTNESLRNIDSVHSMLYPATLFAAAAAPNAASTMPAAPVASSATSVADHKPKQ